MFHSPIQSSIDFMLLYLGNASTLTQWYCLTIKPIIFLYRSQELAEGPTTNQAVRRQVVKADAQGAMVYDIKIEDFDINYGNQ